MAWERSDKISFGAMLISLMAIGLSVFIYWNQSVEKVLISIKPAETDFVHAYIIRKDKKYDAYVKSVGRWYELQISNNSTKTLSFTELRLIEGHENERLLKDPLFGKLIIDEKEVKIGRPVNFPIKIDAGGVVKGFVLLPASVNPDYGKILLQEFRKPGNPVDTTIERIIFDPGYIQYFEAEATKQMNNSSLGKLGIKSVIETQGFDLERPLFQEISEGIYKFGGDTKKYDYGFIHRVHSQVMRNAVDKIIGASGLTIDIASPLYNEYRLILLSGSGNTFSIRLYSGPNVLDPLKSKK